MASTGHRDSCGTGVASFVAGVASGGRDASLPVADCLESGASFPVADCERGADRVETGVASLLVLGI